MTLKKPIVGFVGMTHLGLVSSICAAEKDFKVYCFDPDKNLIKSLKRFELNINEPNLKKILISNKENIIFSSKISDLKNVDIIYVAPDIPTDDSGNSDLSLIENYLNKLTKIDTKSKVTVILSQVPPGFTRKYSKKFSNLYYQVETLIFGDAVNRSLNPERYIIGTDKAENHLNSLYQTYLNSYECPILKMRYESAELAKISINMFLVSSVTTANTIAELCEKIGANFMEIIPALKLDKRIGEYCYLNPGLGISGGNLERDLSTFTRLATECSTDYETVNAWSNNSKYRKNWPLKIFNEYILNTDKKFKISIFGLSYKVNTHSVKNSPSLELISGLIDHEVKIFDPIISEIFISNTHFKIEKTFDTNTIFGDVVIIMNESKQFYNINNSKTLDSVKYFIDPFKVIEIKSIKNSDKYFTLGVSYNKK